MPFKLIGIVFLVVVAAFGSGWMLGASGRSVVELERTRNELRAEYAEARALILSGRVSLYLSNFGDAIGHFQNARRLVGRLQVQLREMGQAEQAGRLEIALAHLSDAQQTAAAFDPHAQGAADEALKALAAAGGG